MKVVGSREFQLTYQKVREPVRVVALRTSRVIGHFYPGPIDTFRGAGSPCRECGIEQKHHGGMTHEFS
jgi:hypothetical protein